MNGINLLSSKPNNPQNGDVVISDGEYLMWDSNSNGWVPVQMEPNDEYRKEELIDEFENNPDLFNEIIVEMRNRKINQIKKNNI